MADQELHPHAKIWRGLPVETLQNERDRIAQELGDLTCRYETIQVVIGGLLND